jgi:hypothetical protein
VKIRQFVLFKPIEKFSNIKQYVKCTICTIYVRTLSYVINVRQSDLGLQFMHIFKDRSKDCSVTKTAKNSKKNLIVTVSDPVHIEIEIPPDLLL